MSLFQALELSANWVVWQGYVAGILNSKVSQYSNFEVLDGYLLR